MFKYDFSYNDILSSNDIKNMAYSLMMKNFRLNLIGKMDSIIMKDFFILIILMRNHLFPDCCMSYTQMELYPDIVITRLDIRKERMLISMRTELFQNT